MLNYLLDSTDGLDDNLVELYEKTPEGKFQLKVEGIPEADNSGLKSALEKERINTKRLTGDLRPFEKLGMTPDEITTTIEDLKKAKGDPSNGEKLLDQARAQHKVELEKLTRERDTAFESERNAVITSGFTAALAKVGFSEEGINLIAPLHASRVEMAEQNGKRVPIITAKDGGPMLGTGADHHATFDDLAKEFADTYPSLVLSDRKGGAGIAPGSGGATTEKTMLRSDWEKLGAVEQHKTIMGGVKLVDS